MSEIPETPTAAARGLIAWFAGGLAFQSVDNLHSSYWVSGTYAAGAIVLTIIDFKLPALLVKSPQLAKSLNAAAVDARWWIGVGFLTLMMISLSPYVEQQRWPFSAWVSQQSTAPDSAPLFTEEQLKARVDAAVATAVTNLNSQISEANRRTDAAQRELNALRSQIQNAPNPPRNLDEPRVFTKLTIPEIRALYTGRTPLQGDVLLRDEIGKWIETDGVVQDVQTAGFVTLHKDDKGILCLFDSVWNPKLSVLRVGDTIKVVGKLYNQQNESVIQLRACELE